MVSFYKIIQSKGYFFSTKCINSKIHLMKKIISVLILLLSIKTNAQDTASLNVNVFNEFKKPIVGEQILFEAQDSSYTIKAVTNKNGKFVIKLLGGKTYNIKIKTIGEAQDYNTMKIPKLEENQKYAASTLRITIYESKSFTLNNVYFDSGKSTLKATSTKELNELYEYLSLKEKIHIKIAGHTDNVGDEESNLLLSKNRAIAVKDFLINKGISTERILISAYGETKPIANNKTAKGRRLNRRIEVLVL